MSTGSVTYDGDFGSDVTGRSSHTSRLASVTQPSEDTSQLSAAAPGELIIRYVESHLLSNLLLQSIPLLLVERLGLFAEQGLSSHGATRASIVAGNIPCALACHSQGSGNPGMPSSLRLRQMAQTAPWALQAWAHAASSRQTPRSSAQLATLRRQLLRIRQPVRRLRPEWLLQT